MAIAGTKSSFGDICDPFQKRVAKSGRMPGRCAWCENAKPANQFRLRKCLTGRDILSNWQDFSDPFAYFAAATRDPGILGNFNQINVGCLSDALSKAASSVVNK